MLAALKALLTALQAMPALAKLATAIAEALRARALAKEQAAKDTRNAAALDAALKPPPPPP